MREIEVRAMKRTYALFFVLLMVLPATATAQDAGVDNPWTFGFCLDNDLFFGRTDRYYTNGLRLSWTSPDISGTRTESWIPRWGHSLLERLPFMNDPEHRRSVSLTIGQNMYTPDDIKRSDLIQDDRPYAGVIYAAVGLHTSGSVRMNSLELALGVVGPHSYAGAMQKEVHELIGSAVPNGWDNQLKDEPIVNIFYERTWKSIQSGAGGGLGYDVLPFLGGALGNAVTRGSTGVQVRFGWNLPNDFGISRIHPSLDSKVFSDRQHPQPSTGSTRFGFYVFSSLNGMAVARNIFLDGNTFTDSHRVDKKPFVAEFAAGFSIAAGPL
jgi:lipid A 3-O-deacylase